MTTKEKRQNNIVYSTENSKKSLKSKCSIKKHSNSFIKNDGIIRIGSETKGRKGKGVTIITGIPLNHNQLLKLAQQLKQKCGAGGTTKKGVIEIQGAHHNTLLKELRKQGYIVKICGGVAK